MRTLEVRCCCQPQKLLGHIAVPDELAYRGAVINFPCVNGEVVSLKAREIVPVGHKQNYLALSSEETPIEMLRTVPSFKENMR